MAAALPALGFLACVKIVLSRTVTETVGTEPTPAGDAVPDPADAGTVAVPAQLTGQDERDGQDTTADLLDQARTVAATHLAEHGRPITRDQLRAHLRTGTNTATVLHRQIKQDDRPVVLAMPADAFTRANGSAIRTGGDE